MKRFWIFILIAGVAIAAMSAFQFFARPNKGDVAPDFTLQTTTGENVSLKSFSGRPVLLHFWASWCGTCLSEIPALSMFAKQHEKDGLAFISISEDEKKGEADFKGFLEINPVPFVVLMDQDGAVADSYWSYSVPENVLIDKNGKIAWRSQGIVDWDSPKIKDLIKRHIEE